MIYSLKTNSLKFLSPFLVLFLALGIPFLPRLFFHDSVDAVGTGVTFVQSNTTTTGGKVPSTILSLNKPVTQGDLLVGMFLQYDSSGQVHVSDNVNGVWTRATGETFSTSAGDVAIYYKENSAAAPNGLLVSIQSDNATYLQAAASDYSNVVSAGSLLTSICSKGTGTAANSGLTAAIPSGQLVFGGLETGGNPNGFQPGSSQGVNFVTRSSSFSGSSGAEDILSSNSGAQNSAFTLNSATNWFSCAGVFKPISNSSPSPSASPSVSLSPSPSPTSHISFVQAQAFSPGNLQTSEMIKFTKPVQAGDLLVGWFGQYDTAGQVHVVDSVNGVWTRAPFSEPFANGLGDIALYYKENSAPAPNGLTIMVYAGAPAYLPYAVSEYSGVATSNSLDQGAVAFIDASSHSNTAIAGPTAPVNAGELVFGGEITGAAPDTLTVGSSQGIQFTERAINVDSASTSVEDILSSVPGSQNSSFTFSSTTDWYSVVATFKPK